MTVAFEIGRTATAESASLDLEELLATRLLVQGNSGSGKSHLLRRLLEQSVPWVQQAVIDPEGDFATLWAGRSLISTWRVPPISSAWNAAKRTSFAIWIADSSWHSDPPFRGGR